jgi:diamine N-acetyltransferase
MIDAQYQGLGFGRRAVELLVAHVRRRPNAKKLLTSCDPGTGSPEGFYRRLGFERTGEYHQGQVVLALELGPAA